MIRFLKYLNEKENYKEIAKWILDKAKSMTENEFQTWFLFQSGLEDKGFFSLDGEYGKAYSYLKDKMNAQRSLSTIDIWEFARGYETSLYSVGNITIEGTTGKISQKIKKDELNILKSLAEFTNREYKNIELDISIGTQWMGVAGHKGFRIPIPDYDDPVDVMFPYDDSIIPIYKEYEDRGYSRKKIWAGHIWFHELGHVVKGGTEEQLDRFAAELTSKWLKKTGKK